MPPHNPQSESQPRQPQSGKHAPDNVVYPFGQPVADNIARPLFVRWVDPERIARAVEQPVDLYEALRNQRRLTVHPSIPLWEMGVMVGVMGLVGVFAGAVS